MLMYQSNDVVGRWEGALNGDPPTWDGLIEAWMPVTEPGIQSELGGKVEALVIGGDRGPSLLGAHYPGWAKDRDQELKDHLAIERHLTKWAGYVDESLRAVGD